MTGSLEKGEIWTRDSHTQREDGVKIRGVKALWRRIGVTHPQAKEDQRSPVTPTPGSGKEGFPYVFQREHRPANPLISNFWPPEQRENKFLCFKPLCL